jgi:hypothetical protein
MAETVTQTNHVMMVNAGTKDWLQPDNNNLSKQIQIKEFHNMAT